MPYPPLESDDGASVPSVVPSLIAGSQNSPGKGKKGQTAAVAPAWDLAED